MPRQRKDKVDKNQADIVSDLRKIPGITVEVNHDDILVGVFDFRLGIPRNYWFEIKDPELIGKTGQVRDAAIKPSQHKLVKTWTGQYDIVTSLDEILTIMGLMEGKDGM